MYADQYVAGASARFSTQTHEAARSNHGSQHASVVHRCDVTWLHCSIPSLGSPTLPKVGSTQPKLHIITGMSTTPHYQPLSASDQDTAPLLPSEPRHAETIRFNTGHHEGESDDDVGRTTQGDVHRPLRESVQREFARPPPATWKRVVLMLVILSMGWFSYRIARPGKDRVIYAQR
jgi:hypothetical protein